jgi:D-alanyl-lipoteichoic acid acyltransferase DltB (MBOAT superfamily)
MLLHTPLYLGFLTVVFAVHWLLPSERWRKRLLLVASYSFYLSFSLRFAILLLLLTTANYHLARAMPGNPRVRQLTWLGVVINLGTLGVFKYSGFFLENLTSLLGTIGPSAYPIALDLIVPIGVSFYTFQALAYTTEVSRGRLQPAGNWTDFALYLGFFPKLVAGPIVRPEDFLQQLKSTRERPDRSRIQASCALLLMGLFKKVVIADSLASLADVAFRAAGREDALGFPSPLYWQGFYLYAIQILADFSGYTDIARGSASLLGLSLPENFNRPYLAPTIGEFWNRWHLTLTQWFREYLFFPLSRTLMNWTHRRHPGLIRSVSTFCSMTLIGLWHGASWSFVGWGAWHGLLVALDRLTGWRPRGRTAVAISTVVTFHLVGLGWVLFRAEDALVAGRFVVGALSLRGLSWSFEFLAPVVLATALTATVGWIQSGRVTYQARWGRSWAHSLVFMALLVLVALGVLQAIRGGDVRPFIYGRF